MSYSNAIKDPTLFDNVFLGGAFLSAVWLVHVVVALESWAHPKPSFRQKAEDVSSSWNLVRWVVFPTAVVLVITVAQTNLAFAARIFMSRDALMTSVNTALRAPRMKEEYYGSPLKVGFFNLRELQEIDGAVRMITSDTHLTTSAGIAYSEGNRMPPGKYPEDEYEHIFGPWWKWVRQRE